MRTFLLADDHHIVRTGLNLIIKEEFLNATIDECGNGDCAWKKIQQTAYDLVILDISMPAMDSCRLLKNIFTLRPGQKVMIFTMSPVATYAKQYLAMGVSGFINKEADPAEVKLAIVTILNNRKYVGSNMMHLISEGETGGDQPVTPFDKLSFRELEIMHLLIEGKNVKQIADLFFLHISTVSTHKANIMTKLNVSNVVELTKLVQFFNMA